MKFRNKLFCFLFGHQYKVVKVYSTEIRKLTCSRCGNYFGMHDGVHALVPWDSELESTHKILFPNQLHMMLPVDSKTLDKGFIHKVERGEFIAEYTKED